MKRMLKFSPLLMLMLILFSSSLNAAEIPSNSYFHIQSAQEYRRGLNKGFWDVPGNPSSFKNGLNIQVWDLPNNDKYSRDRSFRFHKVHGNIYEISSLLSTGRSRIDVSGAKRRNGTNIHLWSRHGKSNQRFKMVYRGGGKWKMYPMIGGVVCLKGKNSNNGSNVHIWNDHNGPWTEWVLIKRGTKSAFIPQNKPVARRPVANMRGKTLAAAASPNQGNITYVYFSQVNSRQFIAENNRDPLANILNRLDDTKRIMLVKKIVQAIAKNPDTVTRLRVYHQLDRSQIFKSSNFLVQMVVKQLQKDFERNYRTEKNRTVKSVIFRMTRKF